MTNNYHVSIQSHVDLHPLDVIKAATRMAKEIDADRLAEWYAERLEQAARIIRERIAEAKA
jgi:hypothetical protein